MLPKILAQVVCGICLAERKPESGASDHEKNKKAPGALDPAHFLALIHTLYIIITKFTVTASSCQLLN